MDDQSEPELFLFKAQEVMNPRLAFVRLLPTDYPLRMLLGNAEPSDKKLSILESKGPKYYLLFINMAAIERYLIYTGDIRQSPAETDSITQFSKIIMSNSK